MAIFGEGRKVIDFNNRKLMRLVGFIGTIASFVILSYFLTKNTDVWIIKTVSIFIASGVGVFTFLGLESLFNGKTSWLSRLMFGFIGLSLLSGDSYILHTSLQKDRLDTAIAVVEARNVASKALHDEGLKTLLSENTAKKDNLESDQERDKAMLDQYLSDLKRARSIENSLTYQRKNTKSNNLSNKLTSRINSKQEDIKSIQKNINQVRKSIRTRTENINSLIGSAKFIAEPLPESVSFSVLTVAYAVGVQVFVLLSLLFVGMFNRDVERLVSKVESAESVKIVTDSVTDSTPTHTDSVTDSDVENKEVFIDSYILEKDGISVGFGVTDSGYVLSSELVTQTGLTAKKLSQFMSEWGLKSSRPRINGKQLAAFNVDEMIKASKSVKLSVVV